ncbi:MAG: ABC transporter permease [Calditrichia bacterium]|nr:ABC transporter permease [Calditrichia bacterium]
MKKWFNLFKEFISFAFQAIRIHKLRSFLTTLGIVIGVATVITIFTTIDGLDDYIADNFSSIGTSTVYISSRPWVIMHDWWKYRNRPKVTLEEYEYIKRKSKLAKWISPELERMMVVENKDKKIKRVLVSASNHDYLYTAAIELEKGRFITEMDYRTARPVCVIGPSLAEKLFENSDPLNKKIKIGGYYFKIIGITEKRGEIFGFDMDNSAIVPYFALRNIIGSRRGISIAVRSEKPEQIEALIDELTFLMRLTRRIAPGKEDNFSINQQDMLMDIYKKLTGTLYAIVFVIGAISLLVGGIGIMNIMLVSVTERTKEIGLRKSVGASRGNIMVQFLFEAVVIALLGGILGTILGLLGAKFVLNLMTLSTPVKLSTVIIGVSFAGFVGVVSGIYPAFKAALKNPIEALHFE